MADDAARRAVDQFLLDEIDSVPHLEALLLLWRKRPQLWTVEEVARALYVRDDIALVILRELESKHLVAKSAQCYIYDSNVSRDKLIEALDSIYRRELVRISNLIHSKASPSVRAFARAFRLKKD